MLELINYEYYSKTFKGSSIPLDSFEKYSLNASAKVNYYTKNRINETIIDNNIRNTACEIAELLFNQDKLISEQNDDNNVKVSETVGPHSVSYVDKLNLHSKRILTSDELDKECYKICYRNLVHTGLMYRGFY